MLSVTARTAACLQESIMSYNILAVIGKMAAP